jgi:tetraacyldisaccharide 4'-kinase
LAIEDYFRAVVSGERGGVVPMLLRGGLRALSVPYAAAARARNVAYDRGWLAQHHASVPVISVGNLTAGGTGKTPCVEFIARFFTQRSVPVAILSRGYGGDGGHNDEALLLKENVPLVLHLQGRDRAALATPAVRLKAKVLVLDDGFQHRRLARDLDIVLIDATEPWGHGYVHPRGWLREPVAGLKRAHVVLLTRCDLVDESRRMQLRRELQHIVPNIPVLETRHRPLELVNAGKRAKIAQLHGKPVAAFCGIGNPAAFRSTLENLGLEVASFRAFPDHHRYSFRDMEELAAWVTGQANVGAVVTTQKDLVKLRCEALAGKELWALRVGLEFESGGDWLERRLGSVVHAHGQRPAA